MSGELSGVDVRAALRMALQHVLICCPNETVQKAIEDADDALAELIGAASKVGGIKQQGGILVGFEDIADLAVAVARCTVDS